MPYTRISERNTHNTLIVIYNIKVELSQEGRGEKSVKYVRNLVLFYFVLCDVHTRELKSLIDTTIIT